MLSEEFIDSVKCYTDSIRPGVYCKREGEDVKKEIYFCSGVNSTSCTVFLMLSHHLHSVVGHRLPKTLDTQCLFAVEMPDLCTVPRSCTTAQSLPCHAFTGSTFAVEIKVCCNVLMFEFSIV